MGDERALARLAVWRLSGGALSRGEAQVIVEEPLQVVVDGAPYAVLMRTPGDDISLAAGFCLAEGLIEAPEDLGAIQHCGREDAQSVSITRTGGRRPPARPTALLTASSCGLCGRELVADLRRRLPPLRGAAPLSTADLLALGRRLRQAQRWFAPTGGAHAVALFDGAGELLAAGEDVGRHNALDKAVGRLLLARRLEQACVAVLSGRVSFEMVQKAARAGVPIVAGVSAPTDLAVALAQEAGLTLVGFLREDSLTVYADAGRIPDLH